LASTPDTIFVDDFDAALEQAKEAAGDKYVNVLGASMGRQCLEAGQLDEIFVSIAPILLGDGVPFFPQLGTVKLERISQTELPLATNLWFKVG
jgi:dihydrofolate reductase